MLSLSELNCRIFQEEMVAPKEAIAKGLDKAIKEGYPDIWSEMQEKEDGKEVAVVEAKNVEES